jgi:WD40 repeat protein
MSEVDIKLIRPGEDIHSAGVKTLSGHSGSVRSVSFSPDGTLLASGSYDGKVKVWDVGNSVFTHSPLPTSHTLTVLSHEPDASSVPSREKETERTLQTVS